MPAWATMVISVPSGGVLVISNVTSLWFRMTLSLQARTLTFSLPGSLRLG